MLLEAADHDAVPLPSPRRVSPKLKKCLAGNGAFLHIFGHDRIFLKIDRNVCTNCTPGPYGPASAGMSIEQLDQITKPAVRFY